MNIIAGKGIKTSEWVSPGHPDKVADGIVSYILDRYMELDPKVRFGLECQVKDNYVTIGGEITSSVMVQYPEFKRWAKEAIDIIGYSHEYAKKWGAENALDSRHIEVATIISSQSADIAKGVDDDGWGDQGIFWGMATAEPRTEFMPLDAFLAHKIGMRLYRLARGEGLDIGLDIKTQVTTKDGYADEVIVAAPMVRETMKENVCQVVSEVVWKYTGLSTVPIIIVNGTGVYVKHSSMGDCGTTGRKLAVDFYGGNCRVGGGCPWGKDPSKADVTLNYMAREIALEEMRKRGTDVYAALRCCIGRKDVGIVVYECDGMRQVESRVVDMPVSETVAKLGFDRGGFFAKCVNGMFYANECELVESENKNCEGKDM